MSTPHIGVSFIYISAWVYKGRVYLNSYPRTDPIGTPVRIYAVLSLGLSIHLVCPTKKIYIDYTYYTVYTPYMPKVTVYIRVEDLDKWKSVDKKTEFIHGALNPDGNRYGNIVNDESKPVEVVTNGRPIQDLVSYKRKKYGDPLPKDMKLTGIDQVKLCKIHGSPLDDRGRCMQKGCKYG